MEKTKTKIREEWINALRSGQFYQIFETYDNGQGGRCALGVLHHVMRSVHRSTLHMKEVVDVRYVVTMNDMKRLTFDQIANWMEQTLCCEKLYLEDKLVLTKVPSMEPLSLPFPLAEPHPKTSAPKKETCEQSSSSGTSPNAQALITAFELAPTSETPTEHSSSAEPLSLEEAA